MTVDDWKLFTILLGIPITLLTIWLGAVTILKPLYKEWNRNVWKDEMARWDEAHHEALAARDVGTAQTASMQAMAQALTEAIKALAAAHDTAMAFGQLGRSVADFRVEVEAKWHEQDKALEEIGKTLSEIRGFMEAMGMNRRKGDRDG